MPKQSAPLEYLSKFIPAAAVPRVLEYLHQYKEVHLTITRERKSILGDYRHATTDKNHRISVNGNLNPYAFLITLIHELAHLVTFIQFGHKVSPHGREWKDLYATLLKDFMGKEIFRRWLSRR
jgi:SprT protein